MSDTPSYTFHEELANSLTHGLGALMWIVGVPFLLIKANNGGNDMDLIGIAVFGFSLLMLYTFSTLYHSIADPTVKRYMRILDHISIFFLIAGSYTPYVLIYFKSSTGTFILIAQWVLTFIGIFFKAFFTGKFRWASLTVYLLMGWMVVLGGKPLLSAIPDHVLLWIVAGGLCYTIGAVFYMWKSLPFHHAIWHLFVLCGSICHFLGIFFSY